MTRKGLRHLEMPYETHCSRCARGGRSRSKAKVEAGRANLVKARAVKAQQYRDLLGTQIKAIREAIQAEELRAALESEGAGPTLSSVTNLDKVMLRSDKVGTLSLCHPPFKGDNDKVPSSDRGKKALCQSLAE